MAAYTYLPWVRQGLIGAADAGTVTDGRLELSARITVSGGAGGTTKPVDVLVFGPGDVTGFDLRQVIRTDPRDLSSDFEPNYFPLVEFDRPDFPWLVTPAVPDANNHLTPWLCLVVVERREGVDLTSDGSRPLPALTIATAAHAELPDLSEAWAWAHAHVGAVTSDADLATALQTQPERALSRLLCPRRLKPKTPYLACVVPTYKGGVQAGLGEAVTSAQSLDPAWTLGTEQPNEIRLPVYYSWEFSTGAEGDFEALVWELQRRQLTFEQVGTRKVDIGEAGYGVPVSPPVDVEGALQPETEENAQRVGPSAAYQQRLQALVNGTAIPPVPVLPPPIYGRWHALQRAIPDHIAPGRTRDREWLRTLNLDPRYRVAAGLGAQVVREQQEQLMAAAWDQVGDIVRANQMLLQAQLARAASLPIHRQRLGGLDATTFLLSSGPVQSRVRYVAAQSGDERTARGQVKASALPSAVTSMQFRRALRPRGTTARRFGVASAAQRSAVVSGLNMRQIGAAPRSWPVPNGMATVESVLDQSPCRITPLTLARGLIESRPSGPLVEALTKLLTVFSDRGAEVAAFTLSVRDELERVAKSAATARDQLSSFASQINQPPVKYLALVLSLYRPALALIADARWLLMRASRGFGLPPPPVIEDLNGAADALPTLDELREINFELAVMVHLDAVEPCDQVAGPQPPPLDIAELKASVHQRLNPAHTIPARVASLIQAPDWTADDLEVVLAAPDFPAPMYKTLAGVSQDWLLPGLERVPANTLALLATNPRFIEAFMVGLNHEMSRELLWRGYPTDQRGTYFRQFWDPSGRFAAPQDDAERAANLEKGKDMPPLHEWADGPLGSHFGTSRPLSAGPPAAPAAAHVVLIIRGDLLRRYPRAEIYFAQAAWSRDGNNAKVLPRNPTTVEKHPIFRGELAPDIQLLGFEVDPDVAQGTDQPSNDPNDDGAGWFVVIQQRPTEPRYGLDETAATSPKAQWTWRDLSWMHAKLTIEQGYIRLAAGLTADFPSAAQRGTLGEEWKWTPNNNAATTQPDGAQLACITLQGPVRVAVHASDLL